jgi:hypothetical protein
MRIVVSAGSTNIPTDASFLHSGSNKFMGQLAIDLCSIFKFVHARFVLELGLPKMLFLSSSITELKLDTSGQILMQRSLKQLLSTTIRDSPCARSQAAGEGYWCRNSKKTETDLHARRTSFICLSTPTSKPTVLALIK